jgi:hypothetical protein
MDKVLWFDCDGVLLDWVRPFLEYIKAPVKYEDLTQYDLSNLFDGDVDNMVETINKFNATPAYNKLQSLVSKESLQNLKDTGYELRVITQVDGRLPRVYRLDNLCRTFGNGMFAQIACVGRTTNKAEYLRASEPYETISVVEDNPSFFKKAEVVGGFRCMAIQHPYNYKELKAMTGFPIYMGMAELSRHLCSQK